MYDDGGEGVKEESVRLCDEELRMSSYILSNSNLKLLQIMYVRFYFIESRTGKSSQNHLCTPEAIAARS